MSERDSNLGQPDGRFNLEQSLAILNAAPGIDLFQPRLYKDEGETPSDERLAVACVSVDEHGANKAAWMYLLNNTEVCQRDESGVVYVDLGRYRTYGFAHYPSERPPRPYTRPGKVPFVDVHLSDDGRLRVQRQDTAFEAISNLSLEAYVTVNGVGIWTVGRILRGPQELREFVGSVYQAFGVPEADYGRLLQDIGQWIAVPDHS